MSALVPVLIHQLLQQELGAVWGMVGQPAPSATALIFFTAPFGSGFLKE